YQYKIELINFGQLLLMLVYPLLSLDEMRTLNAQNQKLQPLKKPKQLRDLPFSNVLKLSRDLLVFLHRLSHVRLLKNYFQFLQLFSFSSFYCSLFNSFKQQSLKNKKSLSSYIGRKGLTSVVPP